MMNLKMLTGAAVAFAMTLPITAFGQGASAPGGMSGEVSIEARFRRLDANGDGYVTWEEARPQRAAEFKRLDRNGDGFLTEPEFEDRAMPLAAFDADHDGKVSAEEYAAKHEQMFLAADTNRDGRISLQEFTRVQERLRNPSR